jgi:prevent-host-death family protein
MINHVMNKVLESVMSVITANDLKTKGVAVLEKVLADEAEAVISVRGKPRYVVISIEQYEWLREGEIYTAWQEAREAVARNDYVAETAEEHITRLRQELADNAPV